VNTTRGRRRGTLPGKGLFISVSGIDGSGKSSCLEQMQHWVEKSGREVMLTREPGGTPLAESLRGLLLHQHMDSLTESLLVFAARRDHVRKVIEPALARGCVVISDRFSDCTFAYQGAGRGFPLGVLTQLEAWVQEGLQPDLTLWFDIRPAEAAARRSAARVADRFEAEEVAFFEKVRSGYAARMEADPERFAVINAMADKESVWLQVQHALASRMLAAQTGANRRGQANRVIGGIDVGRALGEGLFSEEVGSCRFVIRSNKADASFAKRLGEVVGRAGSYQACLMRGDHVGNAASLIEAAQMLAALERP